LYQDRMDFVPGTTVETSTIPPTQSFSPLDLKSGRPLIHDPDYTIGTKVTFPLLQVSRLLGSQKE